MSKAFTPKVITANALLEGDVIYLAADDSWVRTLTEAEVLTDEAVAQVRLLDASSRHAEAVGVYLADVSLGAEGPQTTHFREAFRATGPSNYPHGKQAEG
ncbi:DUF2849 domain-containing protein [Salipiger sp. P9]|uniref:DUF2849 domain-containing protein n=1 Tax=Salipiger pentaromativorans TaxID=2943193 RepID=UPI0021572D7B|nr:DUF2849 domain-containing protein [Salipiger pentaromativorans]MCR8547055.1 DUF2849 domain-containing protein [Salipiger pentaromativorans]